MCIRDSWHLEPLTLLSSLAGATERIGLVSTVSATFFTPFHAARMLASLDHISGGRIGWNVVTSMFDAEAQNHGMAQMPEHAVRYARAEEFVDVVLRLWQSWPASSILIEREHRADDADAPGRYVDGSQLSELNHDGEHFSVRGPLNVPSPCLLYTSDAADE